MFNISGVSKLATNKILAVNSTITEAATSWTSFNKEQCRSCGNSLSVGQFTGISYGRSYVTCVCCNSKFCQNCIHKSICPVPASMWHPDIPRTNDMIGWICPEHGRKAVTLHIIAQSKDWCVENNKRLSNFMIGIPIEEITKPSNYSQSGVAYRLTVLATTVATYTGYGTYVRMIRYAMMGKAVLALLLDNNVLGLLAPLMPMLKEFHITSPQDMLTLYYLACNAELQRKLHPDGEHRGHGLGDTGVLQCDVEADNDDPEAHGKDETDGVEIQPNQLTEYLNILSNYAAPAQWLYSAVLPRPHDDLAWSTWYFSRVIAHEGWTLLASQCKSQKLPDLTPVPAFALVARHTCDFGIAKKEAILVIRGSKSPTDWQINIRSSTTLFAYRSGPCGESAVLDHVHTGMLVAARAILDVFGMRKSMHTLLKNGYDVKVVGHSLGSGVATLVAAELKNGLYRRITLLQKRRFKASAVSAGEDDQTNDEQHAATEIEVEESLNETKFLQLGLDYENTWLMDGSTDASVAGDSWEGKSDVTAAATEEIPRVIAVGFGPPPCVGEALSTALRLDGLVVCMVHRDDIIPRVSSQNMKQLAVEVRDFGPQAAVWMKEDQRRLERYARTVGKEGIMNGDQSPVAATDAAADTVDSSGMMCQANAEEQDNILDNADEECHGEDGDVEGSKGPDGDGCGSGSDGHAWADGVPLVVPGAIIHLTKSSGVYRATLCDHSLACLRRIELYRNTVDDHHMSSHIRSIRMLKMMHDPVSPVRSPPTWQPVFDTTTQRWARCSVCRSDPTWPYITNGDACRALVYHHCRACGKVVCVMCAPAGDSIPDVGVGKYQLLKDFRIPIPSLGLLMPERVCLPCYLHCHQK